MTDTLLPCPFCGDKAHIEKWHGGQPDRHMVSCWNTDCDHDPRVIAETRAEAVQNWNRRGIIAVEYGGEAPPVYVSEPPATEAMAKSIADMVIEWVDGGIAGGTDWRTGLPLIIEQRLSRLMP
ncbi:hypothetical protein FS764_16605 [Agrobacterium vitis]|uniref:Lar family restriction alleviation protein n=1 Tax=Agrobacterium vitis TaxID=373 RepID=UPI001F3512F2|nr:Lar family restriction alleviation protein [Agrobacterium vitis]MCF1468529.1 hypothetical protein [Agrobacterium vitis]